MQSDNRSPRPVWFWPAIAFVLGTLFGLIVLGWGLFPVTYKNTLPPDLRPAERLEYLTMAAESYAVTGDLSLARSRLSTWPPEQLYDDLLMLESRLQSQGDEARLNLVMALRNQLGLETPARPPAVDTETEAFGEASNVLRTLGTVVLWAGLLLGGVVVIAWLWRRLQTANAPIEPVTTAEPPERRPVAAPTGMEPFPQPQIAYPEADAAATAGASWSQPVYEEKTLVEEVEDLEAIEDDEAFAEEIAAGEPTAPVVVDLPEARPVAVSEVAGSGRPAAGNQMEVYRANYHMGEADYDQTFTIEDASGGYLGECSLSLQHPIGRTHDQAAALEALLYDTKDPNSPYVTVLMGDTAYRDSALRDQLAGEHPALAVRDGTQFLMESHTLVLQGVVEKIALAEQEPMGTIIAEMQVRLAVYQKGR